MCAVCDAWTAERHDPAWKAPKGVRQVGRVKRAPKRRGLAPQTVGWSGRKKS